MFFLVENRPIRTPPLLVENSTNFFFFFKPSLSKTNQQEQMLYMHMLQAICMKKNCFVKEILSPKMKFSFLMSSTELYDGSFNFLLVRDSRKQNNQIFIHKAPFCSLRFCNF